MACLFAGLCERWDALQGCWSQSQEEERFEATPGHTRRVRFLERIQSHISSILGSEECQSSVHSHMQEPLLHSGMSLILEVELAVIKASVMRLIRQNASGSRLNYQQFLQMYGDMFPAGTGTQCATSMQGLEPVPRQRSRWQMAVPVPSCAKHAPVMAILKIAMKMAQHTLSRPVRLPTCIQTMGRMAACAAASAAITTAQALLRARLAEDTRLCSRWPRLGLPSSCTVMQIAGSSSLLALLEDWRCVPVIKSYENILCYHLFSPHAMRDLEFVVCVKAQQSEG